MPAPYSQPSMLAAAQPQSAAATLGLGGVESPDEIERRRKKLMAAASADQTGLAKYGSAAYALLGPTAASL